MHTKNNKKKVRKEFALTDVKIKQKELLVSIYYPTLLLLQHSFSFIALYVQWVISTCLW